MIAKEEKGHSPTYEGLKDGGHVYLRCAYCSALLVDIWVTSPQDPEVWNAKAENCPFCERAGEQGGSDPETFQGGFHFGGFERDTEDPEDGIPSTFVDSTRFEGDAILFKVGARPGTRPFFNA